MKYIEHSYNSAGHLKNIKEAILTTSNCVFEPILHQGKLFENRIGTFWDEKKFEEINLPTSIGYIKDRYNFSKKNDMRILDCPIKMKGSNEYRLPEEIIDLKHEIELIAQQEHFINSDVENYFCYITLDKKIVLKGKTGRKSGIHVDGFQGARLSSPLPIDHSYITCDNHSTIFYNQPFKVDNWDRLCHNYFLGFEAQKKDHHKKIYNPYEILYIDAYCLHESDIIVEDTYRTFFRMTYSIREFDRLGNAHNPMFDYQWKMLPRDTQSSLFCPIK